MKQLVEKVPGSFRKTCDFHYKCRVDTANYADLCLWKNSGHTCLCLLCGGLNLNDCSIEWIQMYRVSRSVLLSRNTEKVETDIAAYKSERMYMIGCVEPRLSDDESRPRCFLYRVLLHLSLVSRSTSVCACVPVTYIPLFVRSPSVHGKSAMWTAGAPQYTV